MNVRRMVCMIAAALTAAFVRPSRAGAVVDQKELVEKARAEGSVLWYAIPLPVNDVIVSEFEKRYPGIKVEMVKAGGTQLVQKFQLEQERGGSPADCFSSGLTEAFPELRRKGYLADLSALPHWLARPAWSRDSHGAYFYYANFRVGIMYNTKLLSRAQAPRSFAELALPPWRGRLALFDTTAGFAIPMFRFLVERPELGWSWVDKVKENEPLMMVNAAQVDEAVSSGRRAVAIVRDTEYEGAAKKGAPVAFVVAKEGFMLHLMPVAVNARAPHPYAARLFLDWLLSDEAQDLLARQRLGVPLRGDAAALKKSGGWYLDAENVDPQETRRFLERLNAVLHRS